MKSIILALFLANSKAATLKQLDLSPEAFAEASVQARLLADDQIKNSNKKVTYEENNKLWTQNFMASTFYKNYQQHLAEADAQERVKQQHLQTIAHLKSDYSVLA